MSHISIIYSSVNVLFHVENSLLEVESILKLSSGKKHLIRIFGCDQPYFIKWNISNRQIGLEWTLWNNPKNCFNSTKNFIQTVSSPMKWPGFSGRDEGEIRRNQSSNISYCHYRQLPLFISNSSGIWNYYFRMSNLVMKILSIWLNMPVMIGQG